VTPDQAAKLLQIEERGVDLLQRCNEDETLGKAIQSVQQGFEPADVCKLYKLPFDESYAETPTGDGIPVWECKTPRCAQNGRVSTASDVPDCPGCGRPMTFFREVEDVSEIGHMKRTQLSNMGLSDPTYRTDRTQAPDHDLGDFD
jgi:hypothetical protein